MKKCSIMTLIILAMAIAASGADRKTLLVLNYRSPKGQEHLGAGIADSLGGYLSPHFSLITEEMRKEIMKEFKRIDIGLVNPGEKDIEELKNNSALHMAEYMIHGSINPAGNSGDYSITTVFTSIKGNKIIDDITITENKERLNDTGARVTTLLVEALRKKGLLSRGVNHDEMERNKKQDSANSKALELYNRGRAIMRRDPDAAIGLMRQSHAADPDFVKPVVEMASIENDLSRFDKAIEHAEKAAKMLDDRNEKMSVLYARTMNIQGQIQSNKGDHFNAIRSYNTGLSVLKNIKKSDDAEYSEILNNMGVAHLNAQQADLAEKSLDESLRLKGKLKLNNTAFYAETLSNLSVVYRLKKKPDKELEYAKKALSLKEELKLTETKSYAISLSNMGSILAVQNNTTEAGSYFEKAAQLLKRLRLSDSAEYARLLANSAFVKSRLNRTADAVKLYEEAQSLRKKLKLTETKEYSGTCIALAKLIFQKSERPCNAKPWIKEGMVIKKKLGLDTSADESLEEQIAEKCK